MILKIRVANYSDINYVFIISKMIEEASRIRRTGILSRYIEDINEKILLGVSVFAFFNGIFAGFSYIESFQDEFFANSGMIMSSSLRHLGYARFIKKFIFKRSSYNIPQKILGITTMPSIYKMNISLGLGYKHRDPQTLSPLYWTGCSHCSNCHIISNNNTCLCVSYMSYDPKDLLILIL